MYSPSILNTICTLQPVVISWLIDHLKSSIKFCEAINMEQNMEQSTLLVYEVPDTLILHMIAWVKSELIDLSDLMSGYSCLIYTQLIQMSVY